MPITVIYHSADYDGIFCREIARKFMPDANLIGWNFGDPQIPIPPQGNIYILDLPPDCLQDGEFGHRVIWIDHHNTSIKKWGNSLRGYRIDGVAACRLAWQWFALGYGVPNQEVSGLRPDKQAFIDRKVIEPAAVRLAGEYDVWDKRDPDADTLQYGLRCFDLSRDQWSALLNINSWSILDTFLQHGKIAQGYAHKIDADLVTYRSHLLDWEGLKFLCINTARCNSLTFAAKDVPETGHDALLGYYFNGKCWTVSLYHARHRTDLDLSKIAVKYGGGGHKGACGFTCQTLPLFLTNPKP